MATHIYGFMGFKGSGKDTAAKSLLHEGYEKVAFADTVKDVLATIFGWDRTMLDGTDPESRIIREQVDEWWSAKLGFDISPRTAMTMVGTDLFRVHFHNDIWVSSAAKKCQGFLDSSKNVIVTDCRYPNEVDMVRAMGGQIVRIDRGNLPPFWGITSSSLPEEEKREYMIDHHPDIHESEWRWNHIKPDVVLDNFFASSDAFSEYAFRNLVK